MVHLAYNRLTNTPIDTINPSDSIPKSRLCYIDLGSQVLRLLRALEHALQNCTLYIVRFFLETVAYRMDVERGRR